MQFPPLSSSSCHGASDPFLDSLNDPISWPFWSQYCLHTLDDHERPGLLHSMNPNSDGHHYLGDLLTPQTTPPPPPPPPLPQIKNWNNGVTNLTTPAAAGLPPLPLPVQASSFSRCLQEGMNMDDMDYKNLLFEQFQRSGGSNSSSSNYADSNSNRFSSKNRQDQAIRTGKVETDRERSSRFDSYSRTDGAGAGAGGGGASSIQAGGGGGSGYETQQQPDTPANSSLSNSSLSSDQAGAGLLRNVRRKLDAKEEQEEEEEDEAAAAAEAEAEADEAEEDEDEDEEEAKEEEDGICNEAMNRADGGGVQEAEAMAAEAASESTQKKKTT